MWQTNEPGTCWWQILLYILLMHDRINKISAWTVVCEGMPASRLHQPLHHVTARSPPTLSDLCPLRCEELSFPVSHTEVRHLNELKLSAGKSFKYYSCHCANARPGQILMCDRFIPATLIASNLSCHGSSSRCAAPSKGQNLMFCK